MSETPPQAYISKVHLKGYKSIKDLEIDFKPGLNIIIGPNGSGKTNFLEALDENTKAFILMDNSFFYLEFVVGESTFSISRIFESKFVNINNAGQFTEKISLNNQLIHQNKGIIGIPQSGRRGNTFNNWQEIDSFNGMPLTILSSHIFIKYGYATNISMLDKPFSFNTKDTNSFVTELSEEGGMMVLRLILNVVRLADKKTHDVNNEVVNEVFGLEESLTNAILEHTPIDDIRIKPDFTITKSNDDVTINSLIFEFRINNQWFAWKQLSDGTKRMIQIIFEFSEREDNFFSRIIFLEEPELGIHPDQLYKLMDFLKEQSKTKQIIITTHSPEVLSILGNDELDRIVVTRYDAEKGTQMHHLSEKQIRKGQIYIEEVGNLSSFWVHSNLEEYETEAQ